MLGELDKDCTIRTSGDSASESSVKGDTDDKGITCTRNLVVEEKQPATHLREFRDEIFILKHTLQDHGPLAFFQQFRSTRLSVKLAVSFLSILLLAVVFTVFFTMVESHQRPTNNRSGSSSLPAANNFDMTFGVSPTEFPSQMPLDLPSFVPSYSSSIPSDTSNIAPSNLSTSAPTTTAPTKHPTPIPIPPPTRNPIQPPITNPPTNYHVTYVPGKLTVRECGLLLSEGLRCRRVARTGQQVKLDGKNNELSGRAFHPLPDGAGVFSDPNSDGGWVYVSNSEVMESGKGGVGGIYFDRHGRTVDYRMLQTGTTANCSGGKTPWNTWVTCEERENGRVLQVDPFGTRGMQEMTMDRGYFEAFAYDIRDRDHPRFFVTEDKERGPIRRFSPSEKNWDDPWQLLHAPGTIEYLVLEPKGGGKGTFRWTTDKGYAKTNAAMYYPFTEGIDVYEHQLFFTSKERKALFILHLDNKTFERQSTVAGVFDGMPDQVKRITGDGLLYFCEEGGIENGIHARDEHGWYFTVLESDTFNDESTGLAFSPNGKRMYVAFQKTGMIFDVWREDGLPFNGQTLNVRYHEFRQRSS